VKQIKLIFYLAQEPMNLITEKNIDFAVIRIYDNNIVHVHIYGNTPLTLDQAKEIYQTWLSNTNEGKVWIVHSSEDKFVVPNDNALKFLRDKERIKSVGANAYVARSFSQRLIARAFISLNKPPVPMSFHSSLDTAFDWLIKQQKN